MKLTRLIHIPCFALLLLLAGCREATISDIPYQRVLINDFSAPSLTKLPRFKGIPSSLRLRVDGSISHQVILSVDQLTNGSSREAVRRDTLAAGTYTNKYFGGDYYSSDELELIITSAPGTTGSLTIEWSRQ